MMYLGLPTTDQWETINEQYRPVVDIFTDWLMWAHDIDPRALDVGTLRSRVREELVKRLPMYQDPKTGSGRADAVRAGDISWNRLSRESRMINTVFTGARQFVLCPYIEEKYGVVCYKGHLPIPTRNPVKGLVESAKKCFPALLWEKTPYDIQRFALQQAEAIAKAEVARWESHEAFHYQPWIQEFVIEHGCFPRLTDWFDSMFRVGREIAKWMQYDWGVFTGGNYERQMQEVENALYGQQFSSMVRAQTEQRYVPQPTSFRAPILERVPAEVERGAFDIERLKGYLPFVGIGIGVFRVLRLG